MATLHGCKFIEVSASLDLGVDNLLQGLMTQVHLRHRKYMEAHQSPGDSSSSSTSVGVSKSSSSASSYTTNSGVLADRQRKKRSNSKVLAMGAAASSVKLAQRLIDRLMSIRAAAGKSKSCLDLHSL